MWLIPYSSSTSRAASASPLETLASAAAPKITRLESCPVAPKGAFSITRRSLGGRWFPGSAEHGALEPAVAEGTPRIEPAHESDEVGVPLVPRRDRCGVGREDLAPVRPGSERGEGTLEVDEQLGDPLRLLPPGEVQGHRVRPVARAHPQPVGGHRADLGDEEERPDPVGERPEGLDGGHGVPSWEQVLRLQLLTGTGSESQPEVREPVVPGSRPAELRRRRRRIDAEDRVPVSGGGPGTEQIAPGALRPLEPALHPDLVDGLLPAGEHADAVAAGHDLVEVLAQRRPAQALEHALPYLEGRLHAERDPGDRPQAAETHHHA